MTDTASALQRQLHDDPLPPLDVDRLLDGVRRRRRRRGLAQAGLALAVAGTTVAAAVVLPHTISTARTAATDPPQAMFEVAGVDFDLPLTGYGRARTADLGARGDGITTQVASFSVNGVPGLRQVTVRVVHGTPDAPLPVSSRGSGVPDEAPDRVVRPADDVRVDLWGPSEAVQTAADSLFLASDKGSAFITIQGVQFPRIKGFTLTDQTSDGLRMTQDDGPGRIEVFGLTRVEDADPTPPTSLDPPRIAGTQVYAYVFYPTGQHPSPSGARVYVRVTAPDERFFQSWTNRFLQYIRDGQPVY